METVQTARPESKEETYLRIIPQIEALIRGERDATAVLANVSAALAAAFGRWLWTGFYIVRGGELVLGPFQGPPACFRIAKGRGVCGAAWERGATVTVPDVEEFPGHIACSSLSRSEIVVPIRDGRGLVVGVLDVDSAEVSAFDGVDERYMERIVALISSEIYK